MGRNRTKRPCEVQHRNNGKDHNSREDTTKYRNKKKCGIRGKEKEVDDSDNYQIKDEISSENNDVKKGKDDVPLQTSYSTPIDIAAYPNLESLERKENEEPTNLALPSYPRRNCPTKKNPDFLWV